MKIYNDMEKMKSSICPYCGEMAYNIPYFVCTNMKCASKLSVQFEKKIEQELKQTLNKIFEEKGNIHE
jgi:hypothetical protein